MPVGLPHNDFMAPFSAPDTVGVNDPAGLPACRPIRLSRSRWLAVRRGSVGGKIHPARRGPNPQSIWRRVFALRKQLCCSRSSTVGRRVCSVPRLHPAARRPVVRISQAGLSSRVRPLSASNVERPPKCPLQAPPREPSPRLRDELRRWSSTGRPDGRIIRGTPGVIRQVLLGGCQLLTN